MCICELINVKAITLIRLCLAALQCSMTAAGKDSASQKAHVNLPWLVAVVCIGELASKQKIVPQ